MHRKTARTFHMRNVSKFTSTLLGITVLIDFWLFTLSERLRSYKAEFCISMNALPIKHRRGVKIGRL